MEHPPPGEGHGQANRGKGRWYNRRRQQGRGQGQGQQYNNRGGGQHENDNNEIPAGENVQDVAPPAPPNLMDVQVNVPPQGQGHRNMHNADDHRDRGQGRRRRRNRNHDNYPRGDSLARDEQNHQDRGVQAHRGFRHQNLNKYKDGRGGNFNRGGQRNPSHVNRGPSRTEGHDNNENCSDSGKSDDSQFSRRSSESSRHKDSGSSGFDKFFSTIPKSDHSTLMKYLIKNKRRWESFLSFPAHVRKVENERIASELVHILGENICADTNDSLQEIAESETILVSAALQAPLFVSKLIDKCHQLAKPKKKGSGDVSDVTEMCRFLKCLHTFLNFSFERMPESSIEFIKQLIPSAVKAINQHLASPCPGDENLISLKEDFEEFRDVIREITGETVGGASAQTEESKEKEKEPETENKKPKRAKPSHFFFTPREEEIMHERDPPDDFRLIPIIPTIQEILTPDESFLRPNKTSGAYNSAYHYLDVQFRLLREDFLRPLKNGIQEFMKNKREYMSRRKRMPFGTVRLYQKIRIRNVELVRDTVMYTLQLQEEDYARVKWERSKRLLNGSLLLFTSDNFKSAYFGIIARRDPEELTSKGIFGISWEGTTKPDFSKKNEEFLMFESECFFEAYRHTLQVLKDIDLDEFPMSKYIVASSADVGPPQYLAESLDMMKIGETYVSPLDGDWPSPDELQLDPTQFQAYRAALTKEFAIIQGPPGTGKTFLGLKVVETLLRNPQHWWSHPLYNKDGNEVERGGPILVVCLTNHALDQFLEGILKLLLKLEPENDPGLIRVGGRSKSESLEEFSLARRRMAANKMHLHDRTYQMNKNRAWRRVKSLESERSDYMSEYLGLQNPAGILRFSSLSVWHFLREDFQEDTWYDYIENPTWYGLSRGEFKNHDFNVDGFINRNFQIRPRANHKARREAEHVQPQPQDEEDYDLEELQADRIMDDVYYQAEFKDKGKGEQHHNKDLDYHISIGSLTKIIQETKNKNRENSQTYNRSTGQGSKIEAQNQCNFLKTFLKLVEDGLVEFPQIQFHDIRNLRNVNPAVAWAIYFQTVEHARSLVARALGDMDTELLLAQKELQRVQREGDGILLQNTKVVGMTTTAASKASDLLQAMKSKIVIVEEAAEVLEAHVINCITQYCQHMILIGDHQQLRPNITVLELASKYHLNISLFERMVNNKLNCHTLQVQHRMRPEISDLVRGTIYKELEDHSSVMDFGNIMGIAKNLFFITHKHQESSDSDSVTKTNTHEAKFLVVLCKYLVLQGYSTSKITILATYTGQMFLIKKELSAISICKGVHVTAVDNFQGEENDIILLSMVRSNRDNNVGFLKVDNRICVALSRARRGLFIVGNMDGLVASSPTWKHIQAKLLTRREIGESLPLLCQTHGTVSKVFDPMDFTKYPEGGCSLPCGRLLPGCAHPCKAICHPKDQEHKHKKCTRPCERKCPTGHSCSSKCFQPCKPCSFKVQKDLPVCGHSLKVECHVSVDTVECNVPVLKRLPCGHAEELPCHVSPDSFECKVIIEKKLLRCAHVHAMECFKNPGSYLCDVKVTKSLLCGHKVKDIECCDDLSNRRRCKEQVVKHLACGHKQAVFCYVPTLDVKCLTMVQRSFQNCTHQMEVPCHEKNNPIVCRMPCNVRIKCGHQCTRICHPFEDRMHLNYKCEKTCARNCKNGHPCQLKHKCCESCPTCQILTEKLYPCKTHKIQVKCYVNVEGVLCINPCARKHPGCNHQCQGQCRDPCEPCTVKVVKASSCGHLQSVACSGRAESARCETLVKNFSKSGCGHFGEVPCRLLNFISQSESSKFCLKPCGFSFHESDGGCGHICKGTCSECSQGRIHKKCGEECGRTLVCGHVCGFPCAEACPPCQQNCGMRCDHSQCTRKCGEPCNDCAEPCTWRCEHKKCTKLCRDICDREPCDEPCKKVLRCSHPCIGLCGEPCPPLCRICHPKKLTEFILYGNEEDSDSRFVYLQDCKHCIEVEGMDYYMNNEIDEGAIQAKNCPRCKTLIRHSKRYGNILRRRLEDVKKVKLLVFGNEEEIKKGQAALITELLSAQSTGSHWSRYLPQFRKEMFDQIAQIVRESGFLGLLKKDKIVPKVIDQYKWRSIELLMRHGNDCLVVLTEAEREFSPSLLVELKQRYTQLFDNLSKRQLPLSKMEIKDFDCEFERLFDLKQLYKRKSSHQFTIYRGRVEPLFQQAKNVIDSLKIYGSTQKQALRSLLKVKEKILNLVPGFKDRDWNIRAGKTGSVKSHGDASRPLVQMSKWTRVRDH